MRSLIMPWGDAETMSIFLAHVAGAQGERYGVMILDGVGWRRAHALRVPPTLRLLALPPYSPELNPTEHLWEWLRENAIGNQAFEDLDAVEACLTHGLQRLANHPETVKSITGFEWINTLYLTSN